MYHRTKKKVHALLHPEIVGDKHWDKIINIFIIVLIILNVIAVILETGAVLARRGGAIEVQADRLPATD